LLKRAVFVGLVGGLMITLGAIYPIVSLFAPLWIVGWERPLATELSHGLALMASAALIVPALFLLGAAAAKFSNACCVRDGFKMGVVAGFFASSFCYFTLVAPINALMAYGTFYGNMQMLEPPYVAPLELLAQYAATFDLSSLQVELFIVLLTCFWGIEGAFIGWLRKDTPKEERPSLLALLTEKKNPRHWFAGDESALQMGLLVGVLVGFFAFVTASSWSVVAFTADWPELTSLLQQMHAGVIVGTMAETMAIFSPLLLLAFLIYGGAVVWLAKNPPNWFAARLGAINIASVLIFGFLGVVVLRTLYFNIGLAPFWLLRQLQMGADDVGMIMRTTRDLDSVRMIMSTPEIVIASVLVVPWVIMVSMVAMGVVYGLLQAALFIPLMSFVRPRPVDKALRIQRHLRQDEADSLTGVYKLFHMEEQAYDVLAHLAVRLHRRQADLAFFAAAYHTLGTSSREADYVQSLESLHDVMRRRRDWRWSLDFAAAYQVMLQVLNARSLEQILAIEAPPEQHTSSLPPLLVQTQSRISRIVTELNKVEKVDDLPTRVIFLENALSAIHETQKFIEKEFVNPAYWATPLPQYHALQTSLLHWEEVVLTAVRRLKGRADIVSQLKVHHVSFLPEMPVFCNVSNKGLNVAQQVRVKLMPSEDYDLLGVKSEGWVEILPPGEQKELSLMLMPRPQVKRMRVAWEVVYDDAVDATRQLSFADKVEFMEPERPFTRVFPIPYVTGTPLKTNDVFVGRDDVFSFVQEMLVGVHQNNIVILHGQRRTGKTSVLYRMREVLAATHYAVLVDMQGKPARGEAEFLYDIADDIVFTLEDYNIDVELPPRQEFNENPEFFFRSRFLRGLKESLNGKNLLLMFDEFEELQRRVEDGRLQPEIFQFLRNLMQHESYVDFIFTGTHKLEELGAEYWSALFNIAAYRPITFLSPVEMRRLILEPIAAYNTEYDSLAVERIVQVTAGHPYFAQLLLHEMMVYHNEMKASYLTVVDVDQVIERILGRGEAHFRYIWDESSREEQIVLQALTELLISHDGVPGKELRSFLAERGHQSSDRWKNALACLTNRDIITAQDPRTPLYRFKVDLIRLWVQQARPAL
jgi:hypothetical protein